MVRTNFLLVHFKPKLPLRQDEIATAAALERGHEKSSKRIVMSA
jgi:hypothetical protein